MVTLQIDANVPGRLREQRRRYQTLIHALLRAQVEAHRSR
jgi:uncharacterized protein (DUF4415 family)